jgi:hypothetical protein
MIKSKRIFCLLLAFCFGFSSLVFSQEIYSSDSLYLNNPVLIIKRPQLHYSVGSSFTFIPRYGSITGFNASTYLSYPLTPKLSVEGGFIAGHFYPSLKNSLGESGFNNSFCTFSVYGSASYQLNKRLTVYGTGIKQLAGLMPLYNMPTSSFSIGSTLNFGTFSIGAEIQMSDWNNYYSPSPFGENNSLFPSNPW